MNSTVSRAAEIVKDFRDYIFALLPLQGSRHSPVVDRDGHFISSEDVAALIAAHKPDDTIRVLVQRLGQIREFLPPFAPNSYYTYSLKF